MMINLALVTLAVNLLQPDPDFEAFFTEFTTKREQIHALEARFVQQTVTPDEILEATGAIAYRRPKRLVFRYSDPELVYLIDKLSAYEYDAELKQLQIYQLDDRPENEALFLGFEEDPGRLKQAYHVSVLDLGDAAGGRRALELRPRTDQDQDSYFKRITIEFREIDFLPVEIHIENQDGSSVLIKVDDYRIGQEITVDRTQILLAEGTTIIENGQYIETVGPGGKRIPPAPSEKSETPAESTETTPPLEGAQP